MTRNSSPFRPRSRALALEPRLLFDGAGAVAATDHLADDAHKTPAPELVAPVTAPESPLAHRPEEAQAPAQVAPAASNYDAAVVQAQDSIRSYVANTSAADLAALFNGGKSSPTPEGLQAAEALRQDILSSRYGVQVQISDNPGLEGSFALFVAQGPEGKPVILLNAHWLTTQPSAAAIASVLVEEIGHSFDAHLNGAADTPGDEGQRFMGQVYGMHWGDDYGSDNDHRTLTIGDRAFEAEAASNIFSTADGSELVLTFNSGTRLTGGTDSAAGNTAGTKYLYSNVVTVSGQQIDAIVELTSLSGAQVTVFDSTANPYSGTTGSATTVNGAGSLQPTLNIQTVGGFATFKVTFVLGGSYNATTNPNGTAVTLRNVVVNTYDLDGSQAAAAGRQFTDFDGIGAYTLSTGTKVAVSNPSAGVTRFLTTVRGNFTSMPGSTTTETQGGVTIKADDIRARVRYTEMSSTTIKVGDMGATGVAYYGLDFSLGPTFQDAKTPAVQFVDSAGNKLPGPLLTYENGTTSQDFYLKLESAPESGETVTVTLTGLDTTENSLNRTSVTFTSANWNTPQLVRITAIDDAVIDGDQTYSLTATTSSSSNSIAYTGRTAVIDVTNVDNDDLVAPVLDLRSGDNVSTGSVNDAVVSASGAAIALDAASNNNASPTNAAHSRVVYDDSDRIGKITVAVTSGIVNGTNEKLLFGSTSLNANGSGVTTQLNIAVGGVQVDVTYASNTFTVVNTTGGAMTKAQAEQVIAAIQYQNALGNTATIGDRVFTFQVTDASGKASNTATSTVTVTQPVTVNNIVVNEASPYGVFTVQGVQNQQVSLALSDGPASGGGTSALGSGAGFDYGGGTRALQYSTDGGGTWTSYSSGNVTIAAADGKLLVRTAITNDTPFEGDEFFKLTVTPSSGTAAVGQATIRDDGQGTIFNNDGSNNAAATRDDDRSIAITSGGTFNEASTYATFTVALTGKAGDEVALAVQSTGSGAGHATVTGFTTVQYSTDGSTWTTYTGATGGRPVVPAGGTGNVLVRVNITSEQDAPYEGPETFALQASYASDTTKNSTAQDTIVDDGTGRIDNNGDGDVLDAGEGNGPGAGFDDDRSIAVTSGGTFNEASTYATFTVALTGKAGDEVALAIQSTGSGAGHATVTGFTSVEYSTNGGTSWTTYTGNTGGRPVVPVGGTGNVLVRVNFTSEQDTPYEGAETFALQASYVTNAAKNSSANDTIIDDGTGRIDNNGDGDVTDPGEGTGPGAGFDDDRVGNTVTVTSGGTFNEASTYATFTVAVSGTAGEALLLAVQSTGSGAGHATVTGFTTVEFSTNGGTSWTTYTGAGAGRPVVPAGGSGNILVRVNITSEQDTPYEGPETFALQASYASDTTRNSTATDTIVDDGTGRIDNNGDGDVTDPGEGTGPGPVAGVTFDDDRTAAPPPGPAPAVPVARPDSVSLDEDTSYSGSLAGNDTPSTDGGNVWSKASDPAHGTVVVNADGTFTYTPVADYNGTDSFTYTITDRTGDTSTATVTITVRPVNDLPVANADNPTTPRNTALNGNLAANDRPSPDGGNVWTKTTDPQNGTVVVNPNGTYT